MRPSVTPKPGRYYIDGSGAVHGPLREHPSAPETWLIAVGATYWRENGRHVSGDLSPAHESLNLVREVIVTDVAEAPPVPEATPTRDQIASVMLQHGTEEQKLEALRYAGTKDLEFENGLLTKVGGARPEYMSGYALVHLVRSLAARVRDLEGCGRALADEVEQRLNAEARVAELERVQPGAKS